MNISDMINDVKVYGLDESIKASKYPMAVDTSKCSTAPTKMTINLASVPTGTGHDNFLKGIVVQFDLTMTVKMSVELERYHFIDFVSSQSTMHRITKFDLDKAYIKYVDPRVIDIMKQKVEEFNAIKGETVEEAQKAKEKYLEILYTNPCGMYLTARMTTNYQQLKTIYQQRRNHRLPEWQEFCDWIETLPHFKELCLNVEK
jgi:short subunit dehydrogenase-like uncharacterized protein